MKMHLFLSLKFILFVVLSSFHLFPFFFLSFFLFLIFFLTPGGYLNSWRGNSARHPRRLQVLGLISLNMSKTRVTCVCPRLRCSAALRRGVHEEGLGSPSSWTWAVAPTLPCSQMLLLCKNQWRPWSCKAQVLEDGDPWGRTVPP